MTPSTAAPEKRRALGRGLESLLPHRSPPSAAPPEVPGAPQLVTSAGTPLEIPVDRIDRNSYQTRTRFDEEKLDELAQSIAANGVVQPVVVRSAGGERYQLITGERRLLASQRAGKTTIPAIVRQASDAQAMEMTIVENLQRADLNPMEQARAYQRLSQDFHLTQEQMAVRTGKDRASVSNFLRLLRLPETVQQSVEAGELTFGHARTLLALPTEEQILAAAQRMRALSMSVRGAESYIQGLLHPESRAKPLAEPTPADPNVRDAEARLRRALGLKIRIEDKKGRGRVVIEYASLEDFDTILSALADRQETQ